MVVRGAEDKWAQLELFQREENGTHILRAGRGMFQLRVKLDFVEVRDFQGNL